MTPLDSAVLYGEIHYWDPNALTVICNLKSKIFVSGGEQELVFEIHIHNMKHVRGRLIVLQSPFLPILLTFCPLIRKNPSGQPDF